jgi:lactate dehydrogenase-like 2-hydroxyacid dehydrogenase
MKLKVGVTEQEYNKSKQIFITDEKFECIPVPADEAQLSSVIKHLAIKHVIIGAEKYQDALYKVLAAGSVIARFGVGHDGVNKELATNLGIFCTNTPGVLNNSVAEYTISLLLAAARQIIRLANDCKIGIWQTHIGFELMNKELAVIGCGPIGRRVSRIASSGFGMKVIGCELMDMDITLMKKEYGFAGITKDFNETVKNADFVSLHIPNNPSTYHFVNESRIAMIPEKCWLINTARGAIVDEKALHEALLNNKLSGAILDVFENEPYIPTDRYDLRSLKNVIMLPHTGSSTREACDKMAIQCLQNIYYAESGDFSKMDILNKDLLIKT